MKKSLLTAFGILAIYIISLGQSCNTSTYCSLKTTQNPSSTLSPSSSWDVTSVPAMTPGQYAAFNVTSGNTYEWSTCADFGGTQQGSMDAELTLYNNSWGHLCWDDNSGRTNCPKAPYIGWTATYTGVVYVLLSNAWSGQCLNSPTGQCLLAYRISATGCPTPTGLSCGTVGQNFIQVTWNAVTGATNGYEVQYRKAGTSTWTGFSVGFTNSTFNSLLCGTQYEFQVRANCGSYSPWTSTLTCSTTNCNCVAPTTQASNLNFSCVRSDQLTLSWSNGNGSGRLVKINKANSFTSPTDGITYTPNSYYNGSGEQVVFCNSGNSLTIYGLSANTTYWFRVYEYQCSGTSIKYNITTATVNPASRTTPSECSVPGTQAKNITFSNIQATQMKVNWTNGNGSNRIVKINTSNSFSSPSDGNTYGANSNYGGGEQVIYDGSGNSVTVTNLAPTTNYWFRVYEYNCADCNTTYNTNTATNNPKNQSTADIVVCPSISGLTFCADNISGTGPYYESGNGSIFPDGSCSNPTLKFSNGNNITLAPVSSSFIGSGNLYLDDIMGSTVGLGSGAFAFDVNGTKLEPFGTGIANWLLRLAGLKTQFSNTYMDISCDKVTFPHLSLEFPNIIREVNKNVLKADIYLQIAQSSGYGLGGEIVFDRKLKVKSVLDIDELHLNFLLTQNQQSFQGAIKLKTYLFGIDGDAQIINNQLNSIHLAYESQFGIPIGTTGLRFIKFGGGVSNINTPSNLEISAFLQIMATGIPRNVLRGEINCLYNLSTGFSAGGSLITFDEPTGNAYYRCYQDKLEIGADFNFKNILKGNAELSLTYFSQVSGILNMGFYMPEITRPKFIANALKRLYPEGQLIAESNNFLLINGNDKYVAGYVKTGCFLVPKLYYNLGWNGSSFEHAVGVDYHLLPSEARNAIGYAVANSYRLYTLDASTKSLVIEASDESDIPKYEIYLPDGDTLFPAKVNHFNNVSYLEDPDTHYSCYNIINPLNGNYYIHLTSLDTNTLNVYRANVPPMIKIKSIGNNGTIFQINYDASDPENDAKIRFGLDDNKNGGNGIIIADSLPAGVDSVYTWNSSVHPVAHGKYYLYGLIENSAHQFYIYYFPDQITISGQSGIHSPENLTVSGNDTAIVISFIKKEPFPFNNILYCSNDSNSVNFHSTSIAIGDTSDVNQTVTHYMTNFIPGKFYEFFVTTIDTLFNESEPSNIASFTWISNSQNNTPHIIPAAYPANAYVGTTYNCQVHGVDPDNNPLKYIFLIARPSNTTRVIYNPQDTISPYDTVLVMDTIAYFPNVTNGLLSWTPGSNDIGNALVYVKLSDGTLEDSVSFPLHIFSTSNAAAYIDFSQAYYVDYGEKPMITITDPDYTGSTQAYDNVQLRVYSNSDHSGFSLQAKETQPSSNTFLASFELTSSATTGNKLKVSKGDTIWAEYYDPSQQKTVLEYSYFTIFNADYIFDKDTICSGENLRFINTSTGDQIIHYKWLMGNNDSLLTRNAQKTFIAEKGHGFKRYNITLIIENYKGKIDSLTKPLFVVRPVTLGNDTSVCGSVILKVFNPENPALTYLWSNGKTTQTITVVASGDYSVTVHDKFNCSSSDTVHITVNPIPSPSLTGLNTPCAGSTGNIYKTEAGMVNYLWQVSSGGTITSGGSMADQTATITWNNPGTQSVRVNYSNDKGCTALLPYSYPVTVKVSPHPTITGPSAVCTGTIGNVYTTQTGMTNYTWTVSPGGLITAGGTSNKNTVTITWTAAGTRYVSVNYTNANGCPAPTATNYNVTVNPLPTPIITGSDTLCTGIPGTYTTQTGMTNYIWTVSAGGIIVSGGTTSSRTITVRWNTPGPCWVKVNYTNPSGCKALAPTQFIIKVIPLPLPKITGPVSVCAKTTNVIYSTETGMTGYSWTISSGGTITSGNGSNTIIVIWNTDGAQWVRVNYISKSGCTALAPTQYNVTVLIRPIPYISGPSGICQNTQVNYQTDGGMSNYIWTVSSGGIIKSGQGTRNVSVLWNASGLQNVTVIFTSPSACQPLAPSMRVVNVYPLISPTITGPASVCLNPPSTYSTEAGMKNYHWSLTGTGGTIISGSNTNTIQVRWSTTGAKSIGVTYTLITGCLSPTPITYNVNVHTCSDAPNPVQIIETEQKPLNFNLFPNPNNGHFQISLEILPGSKETFSLAVYTGEMQKILGPIEIKGEGKIQQILDLSTLSQGFYYVTVSNKKYYGIKKVTIIK